MHPSPVWTDVGPPEPPAPSAARPDRRSDAELVARSVTEPESFAELFDRHAAEVHRYLGRRAGERADDLLSETFLIAFRRRTDYRPERLDVRPWLIGIATNLLHGHARAERRRYRALARAAAQPPEHGDDPADSAGRWSAEALRGPLAAALAGLHARDRDVLLLFAWGQLSYEEIAAVLDVPTGTVRSRLNRARRQTRAVLGPASPLEDPR
ncbi:RNA polymerase sigma factor [Geodermatophilus sp. DSM 44513]|uniref:RNA polymerase sigma factor n=1 Tax=Geodermatophilus sp. DSM 44513 TaxID=1528104 RepID=UPI00126BB648|nr:RNA polymerase sigma factor [Geodermatophilus sp. DSM 44513]WNV75709.1 RNA polymerase sigma factor [Geodermatophilus sp. DSM 44513]